MTRTLVLSVSVVIATSACGGDSDPLAGADPRCAALCAPEEPAVDGAFDVCSADAVRSCVDQCETRIAGVESVCASCLLEDAEFGVEPLITNPDECEPNGMCTMQGREGYCTYPQGDSGAREDCMREVWPRREVACPVEFRPVSECAATCS